MLQNLIFTQFSPEIVTIRKSLPAPSSKLSHIWWETSLWSFDKSIELLKSILKRQYWRILRVSWSTSPSPAHEVIFGSLILIPDGNVEVLALVLIEVKLKLLLPLGVQSLIHSLGLVSLSTESKKVLINTDHALALLAPELAVRVAGPLLVHGQHVPALDQHDGHHGAPARPAQPPGGQLEAPGKRVSVTSWGTQSDVTWRGWWRQTEPDSPSGARACRGGQWTIWQSSWPETKLLIRIASTDSQLN